MLATRLIFNCLILSLTLGLALATVGCATTDDNTQMGTESTDWYDKSGADPAAFGIMDAFTFNKKQKRREANDFKFYYKRCALDGTRSYYSKTSYWCTDPF
jgi:hypothetical protein